MSVFDNLVYDRTQADVDRIAELKAKYPNWTTAEENEWLAGMKGSYNASDLNRLGEAVILLYQKIYNLGYRPRSYVVPKTDWSMYDTPTQTQMANLLEDIRIFRDIALLNMTLPDTFNNMTFESANQIERVLYEVNEADIPHSQSVIISVVPSQANVLFYTGSSQSPTWRNYNSEELTIAGDITGTNASSYTVTFTPNEGYVWEDETVDPRIVTWSINRATISTTPSQNGTPVYTGLAITPAWNNYDANKLIISGDTSGTNAGTYTVVFTPTSNYCWTGGVTTGKSVNWVIQKATVAATPTQSGTATYSGSSQSPTWSGYSSAELAIGGVYSATNAGTYTATFTPRSNYQWSNGGTEARSAQWSISKATLPTPSINPTSITLDDEIPSKTISVTRYGDGAITATSSNTTAATVSVGGTTVTVTRNVSGSTTVSISIAEGTNYLAYFGTVTCSVYAEAHVPKPVYVGRATNLPLSATGIAGANNENYAVFAGGNSSASSSDSAISNVTAYNSAMQQFTPANLPSAASLIAGAKVGVYALFAGGSIAAAYNGALSQTIPTAISWRSHAAASIGNFALFAGGYTNRDGYSNSVYSYNASLTQSAATSLERKKAYLAGASNSNYAIFAGGYYYNNSSYNSTYFDSVEAYSAALEKITATSLNITCSNLAGASAGQYALFGGGRRLNATYGYDYSLVNVNVYDNSLTRTTSQMSESRYSSCGVGTQGNSIIAGGYCYEQSGSTVRYNKFLSTVEAFNQSLTRSSPSALYAPRMSAAGAAIGDYMFVAGGNGANSSVSSLVDVYKVE